MDFAGSVQRAATLPDSLPPLMVDIDGTLTNDERAVDPRVFPILRRWPDSVVVATGKAMPFPVALCEFLGIEPYLVAENGGVVLVGRDDFIIEGARDAASTVLERYRSEGYSTGWGPAELPNRWRETELVVSRESPLEPLQRIAAEVGLEVVDTGYAYHVKSTAVSKGTGLTALADALGVSTADFVAIGDSENDAAAFDLVDHAIAVANADERARSTADHVTSASFADGFLEAVGWLCEHADD